MLVDLRTMGMALWFPGRYEGDGSLMEAMRNEEGGGTSYASHGGV